MPFQIQYAEEAAEDLQALRAFDQKKILEAIETHLRHEPEKTSRSRIKLMSQPFWSQYRLRVESFRVYYDVDRGMQLVHILRIQEKGSHETK